MDVIGLWTPAEIKALRVSRRMTQRQFGQHIGIEPANVCRWETGTFTPRADHRELLDRVLQLGGQPVYDRMVEILAQWSEGAPGAPVKKA